MEEHSPSDALASNVRVAEVRSVLDTITSAELMAAIERRDAALSAEVERHRNRIRQNLGMSNAQARYTLRPHIDSDGEVCAASWTGILYADGVRAQQIVPVMIATELREHNHVLLSIVDRSGDVPQYYEFVFDTRDFVSTQKTT
jgi:hypothetical protein